MGDVYFVCLVNLYIKNAFLNGRNLFGTPFEQVPMDQHIQVRKNDLVFFEKKNMQTLGLPI